MKTNANGSIPRGIEVLVKKASVDAEFRGMLLARRAEAAGEIGLELEPSEAAMLNSVPGAQLEAIIASTVVSPMSRGAFLGRAAAAMLAALLASPGEQAAYGATRGVQPDKPDATGEKGPFIVYEQTNLRGDSSFGVATEAEFAIKAADVARRNKVLDRAYQQAMAAWKEDPAYKGVAFPMKKPVRMRCEKLETFPIRKQAETAVAPRAKQQEKQAEQKRKAEQQRLEGLSEAEKKREQKRAELRDAAERLFDRQLGELLASEAPAEVKPE
jgi:hypothetical protein